MPSLRRLVLGLAAGAAVAGALDSPVLAAGGTSINDTESDRAIYLTVLVLVAVAAVLVAITYWFWHTTRPVHPALGPLEVMSERRYLHADDVERAHLLDEARPAEPPAETDAAVEAAPLPPPVATPVGDGGAETAGDGEVAEPVADQAEIADAPAVEPVPAVTSDEGEVAAEGNEVHPDDTPSPPVLAPDGAAIDPLLGRHL